MLRHYVYSIFLFLVFTKVNGQLIINELASSNTTIGFDEENQVSDWVELYNSSSFTVNLSGFFLSDNLSNLTKFNLGTGTLNPGNYLLVYLSGKNKLSPNLHSNFKISSNEYLILTNGITILDSIFYHKTPFNTSYSKTGTLFKFYQNPTPNTANGPYFTWIINKPTISPNSGFYTDSVLISFNHWLSGCEIRYTLDGSEPTTFSTLYTAPFYIKQYALPNAISNIPTNPSFTYPVGSYDSVRANNRGWLPPFDTVNKCIIIKAKAFYGSALSDVSNSAVYFINPLLNNRYDAPIISLIADTVNLFSNTKGIYVYGNSIDGNYNQEGDAWEIPVQFHVFDKNGTEVINEWCGAHLHGGGGRHSTIKSIKLFFRDGYGTSKVDHYFFEHYIQSEQSNLLLRSPGHRPDCIGKDELAIDLTGGLRIDKPHYKPMILFLNNEYWGIHSFREAVDEEYLSFKYNINKDNITILDPEGQLENGLAGDTLLYYNLENFVITSDMTLSTNFDIAKNQMDIDNYIDYYCTEIFLGNGDWPNNNIKFWRNNSIAVPNASLPYAFDGRWRWILYDLDGGFGGSCSGTYPTFNTMQQSVSTAPLYGSYTKLFRGLLLNANFKTDFINRMCDLLNSTFNYNHTTIVADSCLSNYDPLMQEHVERWRYPSVATDLITRATEIPSLTRWNNIKSELQFYLNKRPAYQRKHIFNYFSLVDSSTITLNVNDTIAGEIKINTITINKNLHGINGNTYPWNGIYFDSLPLPLSAHPYPGYKFLYWLESGLTSPDIIIHLTSDSIFTAVFGIDSTYDSTSFIRFNEVSSLNNSWIQDEFGEYNDWLELYNLTNDTIDLSGYYLSDNQLLLTKFQIPSSSTSKINPFGFKLFWCDNQPLQGNLHTNFSLSSTNETVYLTHPDGITIIDSLNFTYLPNDFSYGSLPNGSTNTIYFNYPTPNQSNELTVIEELDNEKSIFVYPNPSQGLITIYNSNENSNLVILDINGNTIFSKNISHGNTNLNLSHYENGFYIIRTINNNKSEQIKLLLCK